LENLCHWLTVMAPTQVIEAKDLPPELMSESLSAPADTPPAAPPPAVAAVAPAAVEATASAVARTTATSPQPGAGWQHDLEREARALLDAGAPEVWDTLTRRFEAQLIVTALSTTRGRRIEAAQRLGIGRNTITRKIQELGLDD
jgi:two-component system nitrogen regulation response regulator GlnG